MLKKEEIEKLMWTYAEEIGSDNITGLHACDNFRAWLINKIMFVYYE